MSSELTFESVDVPQTCKTKHAACTLPNGVKVLVLQEPDTQSCCAAMSIKVGSHFDPPELPGLAHLCEHMLFLGTEKYPSEGSYDKFVSQNGGHSNAWTEDGYTQYYFTSSSNAFCEALDMFVHFFVSPLFTATSLEREVQAVHSEDEKNHSSDYWCFQELKKEQVANKNHPHSRYGNGNAATLWDGPRAAGVDVRARLLEFYNQYYIAENASIALFSPHDPQSLIDAIAPVLGKMRSGPRTVQAFGCSPFDSANTNGTWFNCQTNRNAQSIEIAFPIPFGENYSDSKPAHYWGHTLGHECKGSLLALLKHENLATSLSAGVSRSTDHENSLFTFSISLTHAGVARLADVIAFVFQAIEQQRRDGISDAVFTEFLEATALQFNMMEVGVPAIVQTMCQLVNKHGLKRCYTGSCMVERPSKEDCMKLLEYLTPANSFYAFRLKDINGAIDKALTKEGGDDLPPLPLQALPCVGLKTDKQTLHHKAHYSRGQIDSALLTEWATKPKQFIHPMLHVIDPNPFLATDFSTVGLGSKKYPTKVTSRHGTMHYKQDDRFDIAKSAFSLLLESPVAYSHPKHRFFLRVANLVLDLALKDLTYYAELGSIDVSLVPDTMGFQFSCSGPSHKLSAFVNRVVALIVDVDGSADATARNYNAFADPDKYRDYAESTVRSLKSNRVSQPYELAGEMLNCWTHSVRWHFEEMLTAITTEKADFPPFDEFRAFMKQYTSALQYDAMWFGNLTEDYALGSRDNLERVLDSFNVAQVQEGSLPRDRDVLCVPSRAELAKIAGTEALPFGTLIAKAHSNPEDPNSSVVVRFQIGVKSPAARARADCTAKAYSTAFFNVMRTSETLGYIVHAGVGVYDDTLAFSFLIQSAKADPVYLLSRIQAFLQVIPQMLEKVSDDEFDRIVAAQIAQREDLTKSVNDEATKQWSARRHPFGFDFKEKEVAELKALKKQDLVEFASTHLVPNNCSTARCYGILTFSKKEEYDAFSSSSTALPNSPFTAQKVEIKMPPRIGELSGEEEVVIPGWKEDEEPATLTAVVATDRESFRKALPVVPVSP